MLSRRLTSNVAWAAFSVVLVRSLTGCSLPKTTEKAAAPPAKGYVRLAALTAEHPLQREVRRLRDMEKTLRRLPGPPPALPPASARLPALPDYGGSGEVAAAQERRDRERAALRAATERQLAEYAAGRRALTARLLEQRRAELLGQLAAKDVAAARERQAEIEAQTLERISAFIANKLETYKYLAFYTGQLNAPMDYVVPRGLDVKNLPPPRRLTPGLKPPAQAESAAGEASNPTPYPTMPERLATYRLRELGELYRLDAEIRRIKREGRGEISEAERAARRRRLAEIDAALDAYRNDREIALILREQRSALNAVLGAEDAAARDSLQAAKGGNADQGFDLSLLGAASAAPPTFSTEQALHRLMAQRRELESLIRVSVADAVRDIARNRNADVILLENGAELSTKPTVATNRQDMTQEFKNWLAMGNAAGASTLPAAKGGRL